MTALCTTKGCRVGLQYASKEMNHNLIRAPSIMPSLDEISDVISKAKGASIFNIVI